MNVDTHKEVNKPYEASDIKGISEESENHENVLDDEGAVDSPEVIELSARAESLEIELKEVKDKFMRTLADMENMRRRHERERGDLLKYASEKLLNDLLPVLDSFEKAVLSSATSESHPVVEGVKMVHKQFLQILDNHGLKQVNAVGQAFDPNIHQAIQRIESEEAAHEVVKDEYQKGYTLNGRLVRPSMVSVCVPKANSSEE